jgi:hypothetical protein
MPTDVSWSPTSISNTDHCYVFNGSTTEFPPTTVAWATDGNTGTFLGVGANGSGTNYTTGFHRLNMTTVSLSSGQQIDYVTLDPSCNIGGGNAGNTVWEARLYNDANGNSQLLLNRLAGTTVLHVVTPPGVGGQPDWRASINNMELYFNGVRSNTSLGISTVFEARLLYRRYNRPTLTATGPTGTITNTLRPTVAWTFTGDGLSQYGYWVRVFTAAQYGAGGFIPESSTATAESGLVISSSNTWTINTNLVAGTTYRAYVIGYQRLPESLTQHATIDQTTLLTLGATQYSQFVVNPAPPSTPTVNLPANGATVNTDLPTLGLSMGPANVVGATVKAQWQLATDAGFTANVRTLTEPDTDFRTSGVTNEVCQAGTSELFQAVWFIRGREQDSLGAFGSYSTSKSFTVSHPPSAASLSPTSAVTRPFGASGTITFSWTFTDTSPTDNQTAYQVLVERNSDGLDIYDSGKTVSSAQQASTNIPSIYKDVLLRWSVKLWDSDDVAGSFSATSQFYVRDLGVVTPTSPASGGVVTQPQPTYTWTFAGTGGATQQAYRVVTKLAGVIVNDSGVVNSTVGSYLPSAPFLETGNSYTLEITVFDTNGLEGGSTTPFTASWIPPTPPSPVTLNGAIFDTSGYVTVSWPQNRDANFVNYRVYRQREDDPTTGWVLAAETTDVVPSTYTFLDYGAPGNVKTYYAVTHTALRFGTPVESSFATLGTYPSVTPLSTHYWIVVPDDPSLSFQLALVKADDFEDEWEQEEIPLIGRGRRVERGTHYGIRGGLTAQVYDTASNTAREQRILLLSLKEDHADLLLRNPFGDVYRVSLGDFRISRIAGVGLNEYFTLDLPYVEISA